MTRKVLVPRKEGPALPLRGRMSPPEPGFPFGKVTPEETPGHAMTAQAGAVAAWIYEERYGHNDDAWIERLHRQLPVWETRNAIPLHTTPPAAVPVEALKALVAGWRIDGVASDKYADELTQLIKERSNG